MDLEVPPRYKLLIELRPYFDDQDDLLKLDDEELVRAWAEMKFVKYHIDAILPEFLDIT